jgi:GGDEF domain-containing protein
MDDHALIGPIEPRLGRWMLGRLVATAVRYGHPFAVVLARSPVPDATAERFAAVLRGADAIVRWSTYELLLLLPDTPEAGTARALTRLGDAAPEAELSGVTWNGDLADDLLERAFAGAGSVNPR